MTPYEFNCYLLGKVLIGISPARVQSLLNPKDEFLFPPALRRVGYRISDRNWSKMRHSVHLMFCNHIAYKEATDLERLLVLESQNYVHQGVFQSSRMAYFEWLNKYDVESLLIGLTDCRLTKEHSSAYYSNLPLSELHGKSIILICRAFGLNYYKMIELFGLRANARYHKVQLKNESFSVYLPLIKFLKDSLKEIKFRFDFNGVKYDWNAFTFTNNNLVQFKLGEGRFHPIHVEGTSSEMNKLKNFFNYTRTPVEFLMEDGLPKSMKLPKVNFNAQSLFKRVESIKNSVGANNISTRYFSLNEYKLSYNALSYLFSGIKTYYLRYLNSFHFSKYKVYCIPELRTQNSNAEVDLTFLFLIRRRRRFYAVWESTVYNKATYIFKLKASRLDIYDSIKQFLVTPMPNKRSTLHENPQLLKDEGVPHIFHVNHSLQNKENMERTDLAWVHRMNNITGSQRFQEALFIGENEDQ